MVFLIVQVRSEYAYKKRFSVPTLKIRGKSPLQHFEVQHEKFITHFLFCSYSRIWIYILLFKNFKLRKVRRATVDMVIDAPGRRWVRCSLARVFIALAVIPTQWLPQVHLKLQQQLVVSRTSQFFGLASAENKLDSFIPL